jgi:hypothetical protein
MARGATVDASHDTARAQPRCQAVTKLGAACRAFAVNGPFCRTHDPDMAEAVQAARKRGGATSSKLRALRARRPRLDTPGGLVRWVAQLLGDVADGRVSPEVGRVLFYGVGQQRSLLEASDLAARIAALEQRDAGEKGRRWG